MYLATTDSPAHYIEVGKVYVKPSGGTVTAVLYPTVSYNDSTIPSFPTEYIQKVVLYGAIQACISKYFGVTSSIGSITMDTITAPTAPTAPSFTYTDASAGTFTPTTITALGTAPTFPTIDLGTYTSTVVGSLGTPPEYTKTTTPATSYTNTETRLTNDDVELANSELNKIQTQLQEFQNNVQNEFNEFTKENAIYNTTVQKALEDARLAQERILKNAQDLVQKNTAQAQLDYQKLLSQIADEKDIKIRQALIDQERILTNATTTTNLNIQNKAQDLVKQVQEYEAKLQKYQTELSSYNTDVQKAVAKLNGKISSLSQSNQFYTDLYAKLKAEYEAIV